MSNPFFAKLNRQRNTVTRLSVTSPALAVLYVAYCSCISIQYSVKQLRSIGIELSLVVSQVLPQRFEPISSSHPELISSLSYSTCDMSHDTVSQFHLAMVG